MRHLRWMLLGIALLLPLGCSGDKEEEKTKTGEKTTENAAGKTQEAPGKTTPPPNKVANNTPVNNAAVSGDSVLALVPQNTALLLRIHPSALLASPFMKSLPIEGDEQFEREMASMKADVGFDVRGIASISLAAWPGDGNLTQLAPLFGGLGRGPVEVEDFNEPVPDFNDCNVQPPNDGDFDGPPPGGPGGGNPLESLPKFDGAVYVQFNQPVDVKQLQEKFPPLQDLQQADFQGKSIWVHPGIPAAGGAAVYQPDSQTMVITLKNDLADIFGSTGQGLLATEAGTTGSKADFLFSINLEPLQDSIKGAVQNLPLPAQMVTRFKGMSLFVDANTGIDVDLNVNTQDEQAAQMVQQLIASAVTDEQIDGLMNRAPKNMTQEEQEEAKKLLQSVKDSFKTEIDGTKLHVSLRVPESATEFIKKGIKQAEDAAKRMQGQNNLKQIAIACLNFHDVYNQLPFPTGPTDQKSKLSWRVHLLPYLDQQPLYEQFKLDEAWDSEHNKALLEQMPDVFAWNKDEDTQPGYTQIVAPAGAGFTIDGDKTRKIANYTDGTSNTIQMLVVKPEKAVPWTKPGGFSIDPAKAMESLHVVNGNFVAAFADGSVHTLPADIDAETLKGLLTIGGGERVEIPE